MRHEFICNLGKFSEIDEKWEDVKNINKQVSKETLVFFLIRGERNGCRLKLGTR
jgi:hypothetical protein